MEDVELIVVVVRLVINHEWDWDIGWYWLDGGGWMREGLQSPVQIEVELEWCHSVKAWCVLKVLFFWGWGVAPWEAVTVEMRCGGWAASLRLPSLSTSSPIFWTSHHHQSLRVLTFPRPLIQTLIQPNGGPLSPSSFPLSLSYQNLLAHLSVQLVSVHCFLVLFSVVVVLKSAWWVGDVVPACFWFFLSVKILFPQSLEWRRLRLVVLLRICQNPPDPVLIFPAYSDERTNLSVSPLNFFAKVKMCWEMGLTGGSHVHFQGPISKVKESEFPTPARKERLPAHSHSRVN